jgi:hypothetical protein
MYHALGGVSGNAPMFLCCWLTIQTFLMCCMFAFRYVFLEPWVLVSHVSLDHRVVVPAPFS